MFNFEKFVINEFEITYSDKNFNKFLELMKHVYMT